MSDLQCPARFVLRAEGDGRGSDAVLLADGDPWQQLEDLADLHRGETVVVVVPADRIDELPGMLRPPATVDVDADGWRVVPEGP